MYLHPDLRAGARGDLRRRRLPRAGAAHRRGDDRLLAGRGRRGAGARSARPTGRPRCARGSTPRRCGRGYDLRDRRAGVGRAARVRLLRLLQGARRGVRAADLPVGLAEGAPPGRVPRRRPHPRPGHVPQAADPRRRAQPRRRDPRPRRQRLRGPTGRAGRRDEPPPEILGEPRGVRPMPGCPTVGVRHPALARRRQGHRRAPRSSGSSPASPTRSLSDFWHRAAGRRARSSERLVVAGGFDALYGIDLSGRGAPPRAG